jgi:hypothetical protein
MMIAAAQPTPALTVIAAAGQFKEQAPHSMQVPRRTIRALPETMSNTACGQTSTQAPQPIQASGSSAKVSPFFR